MVTCTKCGASIGKGDKVCPECGVLLKRKNRRSWYIARVCLVLLFFGLAVNLLNFCSGMSSDSSAPVPKELNM